MNFASSSMVFVERIISGRNADRKELLQEELDHFHDLPHKKWNAPDIVQVRVSSSSTVQIFDVPSPLV